MYRYFADVLRIIDGDTMEVFLDVGFKMRKKAMIRLEGVDTAETYGVSHDSDEYRAGKEQEKFVREWVENSSQISVRTKEKGKYGRWVATVTNESGESLNHMLIQKFDVGKSYE
jgi:micrococcal nuclease